MIACNDVLQFSKVFLGKTQMKKAVINFSDHCDSYTITDFPNDREVFSRGARLFCHLSKD